MSAELPQRFVEGKASEVFFNNPNFIRICTIQAGHISDLLPEPIAFSLRLSALGVYIGMRALKPMKGYSRYR